MKKKNHLYHIPLNLFYIEICGSSFLFWIQTTKINKNKTKISTSFLPTFLYNDVCCCCDKKSPHGLYFHFILTSRDILVVSFDLLYNVHILCKSTQSHLQYCIFHNFKISMNECNGFFFLLKNKNKIIQFLDYIK